MLMLGFILQWGSCLFFLFCLVMVNFMNNVWVVWAWLMTFAVLISIFKRTSWLPFSHGFYFGLTLLNILAGLTFTALFKRKKRLLRERTGENSMKG